METEKLTTKDKCLTAIANILSYLGDNFKKLDDQISVVSAYIPKLANNINDLLTLITRLKALFETEPDSVTDRLLRDVATKIGQLDNMIKTFREENKLGFTQFLDLLNLFKETIYNIIKERAYLERKQNVAPKLAERETINFENWPNYSNQFQTALVKYHKPEDQTIQLRCGNLTLDVKAELIAFISFVRRKDASKANIMFRYFDENSDLEVLESGQAFKKLITELTSILRELAVLPTSDVISALVGQTKELILFVQRIVEREQ